MTNLMFGRGRGVAIGTPVAGQVAAALLAHGRIQRGFLGVTTQPVALPGGLVKQLSLQQERGLVIIQVATGSAAEQGGLLLGDILLRINDRAVEDADELRRAL